MGKTNARLRHLVLGLAVAAAAVLVGCAPQANDVAGGGSTGQDEPAAVDFSWSQEADCAMCHAAESASVEDASCQAAMHEQQGVPCSGCHADEAGLATASRRGHDRIFRPCAPEVDFDRRVDVHELPWGPCGACHRNSRERCARGFAGHDGESARASFVAGPRRHRLFRLPPDACRRRCGRACQENLHRMPSRGRIRVRNLSRGTIGR